MRAARSQRSPEAAQTCQGYRSSGPWQKLGGSTRQTGVSWPVSARKTNHVCTPKRDSLIAEHECLYFNCCCRWCCRLPALGGNLDNPLQPFSQVDSREGLDQVHKDLERLPIEGRLKGRPFLLGRDYWDRCIHVERRKRIVSGQLANELRLITAASIILWMKNNIFLWKKEPITVSINLKGHVMICSLYCFCPVLSNE